MTALRGQAESSHLPTYVRSWYSLAPVDEKVNVKTIVFYECDSHFEPALDSHQPKLEESLGLSIERSFSRCNCLVKHLYSSRLREVIAGFVVYLWAK